MARGAGSPVRKTPRPLSFRVLKLHAPTFRPKSDVDPRTLWRAWARTGCSGRLHGPRGPLFCDGSYHLHRWVDPLASCGGSRPRDEPRSTRKSWASPRQRDTRCHAPAGPSRRLGRRPEGLVAEWRACRRPVCDQSQHCDLGLQPVGGIVATREELCDLLGR